MSNSTWGLGSWYAYAQTFTHAHVHTITHLHDSPTVGVGVRDLVHELPAWCDAVDEVGHVVEHGVVPGDHVLVELVVIGSVVRSHVVHVPVAQVVLVPDDVDDELVVTEDRLHELGVRHRHGLQLFHGVAYVLGDLGEDLDRQISDLGLALGGDLGGLVAVHLCVHQQREQNLPKSRTHRGRANYRLTDNRPETQVVRRQWKSNSELTWPALVRLR